MKDVFSFSPPDMVLDVGTEFPTLILEDDTGFLYEAQTGGIACSHPVVRGVPLFPFWLHTFEESALAELGCQFGCFATPFTEDAADHIEKVWPQPFGNGWWIQLDRDRLSESMEAWFPVRVIFVGGPMSYEDPKMIAWLENRRGILIMRNCD